MQQQNGSPQIFSGNKRNRKNEVNLAKRFSGEPAFGVESSESGMVVVCGWPSSSAASFGASYAQRSPPYAGGANVRRRPRFLAAVEGCWMRNWRERLKIGKR